MDMDRLMKCYFNNKSETSPLKDRIRFIKALGLLSDCDVVLAAGLGGKVYNCHRLFLELASPMFHQLLQEDPARKSGTGEKPVIHISSTSANGMKPSTMDKVLSYVYLDEVEVSNLEEALALVEFSLAYRITGLLKPVTEWIGGEMGEANALQIYGALHGLEKGKEEYLRDILEKAMGLICGDADRIVGTYEFLELPEPALLEILKRDELQVSSELKLYKAVKIWGKLKCLRQGLYPHKDDNLRRATQNLIQHIRFPLVSPEEFTINVGLLVDNNGILGSEDVIDVYRHITLPTDKRTALPPTRFKSVPREYCKVERSKTTRILYYSSSRSFESLLKLKSESTVQLQVVRNWYRKEMEKPALLRDSIEPERNKILLLSSLLRSIFIEIGGRMMPEGWRGDIARLEHLSKQGVHQIPLELIRNLYVALPEPLSPILDEIWEEMNKVV